MTMPPSAQTMGDGEIYAVTADWLKRANEAFDALPRGARVQCATDIGCSPAALTRILSGDQEISGLIGLISDWLKIERPPTRIASAEQQRLLEVAAQLDDEEFAHLLWVAERFAAGRREASARSEQPDAEPVRDDEGTGKRGRP
jgi:hypothetical protein